MTDMPIVQMSSLLANQEDEIEQFLHDVKVNLVSACLREVSQVAELCNIPSYQELMNATLERSCNWNAVTCFRKYDVQSEELCQEQCFVIQILCASFDRIGNIWNSSSFTKNNLIWGFPGGGFFCMCYCLLYVISKGMCCLSAALMSKRSIELGGFIGINYYAFQQSQICQYIEGLK